MNLDEIHEVIPITESFGLWHPQEGVVNGHMHATEPQKIKKIGQLRQGVSKVLEDLNYTPSIDRKYVVADMITGFGVAEGVRHYYNVYGGDLKGKRVIVQGWGNVGSAGAYYLAQDGAIIVGIIDRVGGLIKEEGFTLEEIRKLFVDKDGNKLHANNMMSFEDVNAKERNIKIVLRSFIFLLCINFIFINSLITIY